MENNFMTGGVGNSHKVPLHPRETVLSNKDVENLLMSIDVAKGLDFTTVNLTEVNKKQK